jgi:hypothetical protein
MQPKFSQSEVFPLYHITEEAIKSLTSQKKFFPQP